MNLASKDLNLLVPLRALLEEGNVTRAGERLAMTQSAMSSVLGRLRQYYQDELLVRVGRDFELTPLARMLLPEVQTAVPLLERALGVEAPFDPASVVRRFTIMGSDFAWLEINDLLLGLDREAPGALIDYRPLPSNPTQSMHDLLQWDFIAALPGIGIEGESAVLFRDHYVCLIDERNPALIDGRLDWSTFCTMPHAVPRFGINHRTPAERHLRELGYAEKPAVVTHGFVPLASLIADSPFVAVVPSRLAARFAPLSGTIAVEAPFDRVEIVETLWWHSSKNQDGGHRWLRDRICAEAS